PQTLAAPANARGASWSSDGTILFVPAPPSEMLKIPASGGTPSTWKPREPGVRTMEAPYFLPDGKHFLYFNFDAEPQKQGLYAGSLDSNDVKRVPGVPSKGEYANGYLFYCKGADLFAQEFDLSKLELRGEAKRIASNIGDNYGDISNRAFAISAAGTLAYSSQATLATTQLTWFDRSGKQLDSVGEPGYYFGFSASPDGKKVALEKTDAQT